MQEKRSAYLLLVTGVLSVFCLIPTAYGLSDAFKENIY